MPRPSMKSQRSEQILDAYLTCVARFGLEGATQERIAAEAGVKRPLLRHYLGNREEMVAALRDHVVETFNALTLGFGEVLNEATSTQDVVELLFADDGENDPRLLLAWQALSVSAADHDDMRLALLDSLEQFLGVLRSNLVRLAPKAKPEHVRAVAQGLSASFVNLDSLTPLSPPPEWRDDLKQSATLLVSTLETGQ